MDVLITPVEEHPDVFFDCVVNLPSCYFLGFVQIRNGTVISGLYGALMHLEQVQEKKSGEATRFFEFFFFFKQQIQQANKLCHVNVRGRVSVFHHNVYNYVKG